jgi:hypothetical protein
VASEGSHAELEFQPALDRGDFDRERRTVVRLSFCKPPFSRTAEFQHGYVLCTICALHKGGDTEKDHNGNWPKAGDV